MRQKTSKWYEVKVAYDKTLEDGRCKKVTELFVVEAMSFAEAEAMVAKDIVNEYITGDYDIKAITIPHFKMCDQWWPVVQKWHEHPDSFKSIDIKTLTGTYTIVSYKNDVLTAGCHQISYAEMEHVMRQVREIEKNAA